MPDTTTAAVERLAARHASEAGAWASDGAIHDLAKFHHETAATLRALAAERDAADLTCETAMKAVTRANAERDAARAEAARMREALLRWQHYGCPDCGGDCGSANPPVSCCIMQETRAALGGEPKS